MKLDIKVWNAKKKKKTNWNSRPCNRFYQKKKSYSVKLPTQFMKQPPQQILMSALGSSSDGTNKIIIHAFRGAT
jgi:hypothetical protein